jgi:hypothetical protein
MLADNRRFSRLPGGRRLPNHQKSQQRVHIFQPSQMKTTDEYKATVANAIEFKHENPDENATTAARIHHINAITVRSNLSPRALESCILAPWQFFSERALWFSD